MSQPAVYDRGDYWLPPPLALAQGLSPGGIGGSSLIACLIHGGGSSIPFMQEAAHFGAGLYSLPKAYFLNACNFF